MATKRRRINVKQVVEEEDELTITAGKTAYETLTWDQIELWQQDNHYIFTGYRRQSNSIFVSFRSLFYLHNESVNVYSHFLGAIALLLTGAYLYGELQARYPSCTATDILMFAIFLLSAASCFLLSAMCHLISNHSQAGARVGTSLDYLGIVVFIEGTCVSGFYYGLRHHETLMHIYWTMILIIGTVCAAVAMIPVFHTPPWRATRAVTFISLGLFSVIPIIHGIYIYGFTTLERLMGLRWTFIQGFFYILGCFIFASRVPERWYPGGFDLIGASHQLFHFCAVVAAVFQLKALLLAFDHRHGQVDI